MTTLAPPRPIRTQARVTFPYVLRSEWIKFWTLRSTVWTLAVTVALMAAVSFLAAYFTAKDVDNPETSVAEAQRLLAVLHDPSLVIAGIELAQLAVAVLGVLVVTGEYTTGMIRSSLTAVPTRLPVLWAKAIVVSVVTLVASLVGTAASWAVTHAILRAHDASVDLADTEVRRILLGGSVYLVGIVLLGVGVGALVRVSAGALATVLGMLLVVENLFRTLPADFFRTVSPFLPATAGHQLMATSAGVEQARASSSAPVLDPAAGLGVMVIWIVVVLVAAAVTLRRRDA
jgi:ABC-2 type transport system permease protein